MKSLFHATLLLVAVLGLCAASASAAPACSSVCDPLADCNTVCESCGTKTPFLNSGCDTTCGYYGACFTGRGGSSSCHDPDGDSICTPSDNCPEVSNPGQEDCDGDGTGDVCDSLNANYQYVANSGQACYINGQSDLVGGAFLERYFQGTESDVSSCGAPDRSTCFLADTHFCPSSGPSACCWSWYASECTSYLNNLQCSC